MREAGLTFRQAHHVSGRIVRLAEDRGARLDALSLADMQGIDARITADAFKVLGADRSAASRLSEGGTAPRRVRAAITAAEKRFLKPAPARRGKARARD